MEQIWIWSNIDLPSSLNELPAIISKCSSLFSGKKEIFCVVISEHNPAQHINLYGADKILWIKKNGSPMFLANELSSLAQKYNPWAILFPNTLFDSKVAAFTAAKLQTGLSADCTDIYIHNSELSGMHRPAFGGGIEADIICPYSSPQMATIHIGAFKKNSEYNNNKIPILIKENPCTFNYDPIVYLLKKKSTLRTDLSKANIIVAGGLGVGSKKGFETLQQLADILHGELAGSRAAVDAGYLSWKRQIGQTGCAVCPKIYFAFGISGAPQHVSGIKNSSFIISINTDDHAPIFNYSNIAIHGDWYKTAIYLIDFFSTGTI